jgi:exosortase/archaeosortase family protein
VTSGSATSSGRDAYRFVVIALLWALLFFGLFRLSITQTCVLLPLTSAQGDVARWLVGLPRLSMAITLDCSASDVMALCLAFTLAYPVRWRQRLGGAAIGLAWILAMNTTRLAVLERLAMSPAFGLLHIYVWPSLLIAGTLAYLALWVAHTDGWQSSVAGTGTPLSRFLTTCLVAVAVFAALAPALYRSDLLIPPAIWVTAAAARVLNAAGYAAAGRQTVLYTPAGTFFVTPECMATPLMPLYLSGVLSLTASWRGRVIGLLAFVPVFGALLVARLLTVALPPVATLSPLFVTHGFHQFLLGAVIIATACLLRPGNESRTRRACRTLAVFVGVAALTWMTARSYTTLVTAGAGALSRLIPSIATTLWEPGDLQGALLVLPMYQVALFAALWAAWHGPVRLHRAAIGVAVLYLSQLALLVIIGDLHARWSMSLPTTLLRAWAVGAPLLGVWLADPSSVRTAFAARRTAPRSSP